MKALIIVIALSLIAAFYRIFIKKDKLYYELSESERYDLGGNTKNNFNLEIFFKELSNNLLNKNTDLDLIVAKANENKDFIWEGDIEFDERYDYKLGEIIDFNPNYCIYELIFPILDNSLKYEPIFKVFSAEGDNNDLACKYGYISSSKKEESFLFYSNGYDANVDGCPIKMFSHKVKKEELNNFPNLILDHYKTTLTSETISPSDVYIHGDYQWNLNYLTKVLDKSLQARRKQAEEIKKNVGTSDYVHSIRIYKEKNNKTTTVKVLK